MGIRFYNLNGFFVKKLAHGVDIVNLHRNGDFSIKEREFLKKRVEMAEKRAIFSG